jgi:hypothetical protein
MSIPATMQPCPDMQTYLYIYVYTYISIYTCPYLQRCSHALICKHVYLAPYKYIYIYIYIYIYTYINVYSWVKWLHSYNMYVYIYIYIYMYIYIYTYICIFMAPISSHLLPFDKEYFLFDPVPSVNECFRPVPNLLPPTYHDNNEINSFIKKILIQYK